MIRSWILVSLIGVFAPAALHAQPLPPRGAATSKPKIADRGRFPADVSVLAMAGEADVKFDPATPAPDDVLGFMLGNRPVRHLEIRQYLQKLDAASDRVTLRPYAATHEGRALYYAIVTDPANMAKLDAIRADLGKLADPRTTDNAEAQAIIDRSPAVAWMEYCVHGDEMSGSDAALAAIYRLAAGRDQPTMDLLKQVVVIIDPLENPDGRERFLSMLEQYGGRIPNGDEQSVEHDTPWPWGRTNHYLFDMNRDWYVTTQPETRGRVKAINEWFPQLVVDGHEMEPPDTFLFSPPTEPFNVHIPPTVRKWFDQYAAEQADAFDKHGWSYYRGEWNEAWAIGFADVWAMHHGAAGILFEQARSHGSFVKLPTGLVRHYREDVAHQLTGTLANLRTLASHRKEFLAEFYADKKNAVADARGNGGRDVFLVDPHRNRTRAAEFLQLLQRQQIEVQRVTSDAGVTFKNVLSLDGRESEARPFPVGTLVVSTHQPLSPLIRAMLEFDPHLSDEFLSVERRELELKGTSRLYDITAWCLASAFDLDACWARGDLTEFKNQLEPARIDAVVAGGVQFGSDNEEKHPFGWIIDGDDDAGIRRVGRLLQDGWNIRCGNKPFKNGDHAFPVGSFLIRGHENPDRKESPAADESRLEFDGLDLPPGVVLPAQTARSASGPDLGGGEFPLLREPKIALIGYFPFSSNSYGAIWHLLDARLGLRISRLLADQLGGYDLRKYNVIILPDAEGPVSRVLNESVREKLTDWIKEGGTLIAIGGTAATLAVEKDGIGSVRLRSNVLGDLDVYAEAVWRERQSSRPQVDPSQIWEFDPAKGYTTSRPSDEKIEPEDEKARQRYDAWSERFMPHGALLRADVLPEHWLGHGMSGDVPVMYGESHVLMSMLPVETPVRLASADRLRLGGLLWPEARQRLADGAYLTRESIGSGQLILFAADPTYRDFMRGTERLFLNAVILGPGLGTSAPTPW